MNPHYQQMPRGVAPGGNGQTYEQRCETLDERTKVTMITLKEWGNDNYYKNI